MDPRWSVGDQPAMAEDAPTEDVKATPENSQPNADVEAQDATEAQPKKRKSFLSNLLDLPSLDTESIKKEELGHYLEVAERKKRQVEERLVLLRAREEQLKGLESSIDDKLRRLDEERQFFSQTLQKEKVLKGERLDQLIEFYKKMEPKKAGPIFAEMDKDLVVSLFKAIPQKQTKNILETMEPQKSVELSEYFGRVRSAREYDLLKEMNKSLRSEFDECKGMPQTTGS
jgi:flagellar motility protein MotE (MotC chaperone)